jgi:hypothetical protein
MASKHSAVTELREDVSRFVVHLTRDDRDDFKGGGTAKANFLAILKDKRIYAFRSHCLHHAKIKGTAQEKSFKVACFTEVPLNQIRFLVGPISGRNIELEPYGFVFRKEYLIDKGAQPAIYINSYSWNSHLREAVDEIYETAKSGGFKGKIWRLLPFINAMHEKYDFTWEREWRTRGSFSFAMKELVCVILPADEKDEELRDRLAEAGIPAISPEWTYERIVAELAQQQRKTTLVLGNKLTPKKVVDKVQRT